MKETITIDLIQSAAIGALALVTGMFLTRKIGWLQKFCIPSPVSGGIIFSVVTLLLYTFCDIEITFDSTLKDFFMLTFFTSVGFQSDLKVIKHGGKALTMMLVLLVLIIFVQNLTPLAITNALGIDPLFGMAAGSISMAGGHGTAGGFSDVLESMGLHGANTIAMAAATFGLIAGSVIGGPVAERLIRRHLTSEHLEPKDYDMDPGLVGIESEESLPSGRADHVSSNEKEFKEYAAASYTILIAMGLGTIASLLLQHTGIHFPTYFGALIVAAILRNAFQGTRLASETRYDRITSVGNIALSLFLGMAMMSLKLWELQTLALPLLLILVSQVVVMIAIANFVAFRMLGSDYDAAVLVAGICGFGLGATPNAMANMNAVCYKYHYTVKPFLVVPIIGAMFVDLLNTAIITLFLNVI